MSRAASAAHDDPQSLAARGSRLPSPAVLAVCFAGVGALLAAAAIGAEILEKPLTVFLEEPAQDGSDVWYAGLVSTAGALLWWSAATVSYVTAWVARERRAGVAGFWLGAGVLSTVLALDDLFLLHEYVVPTHFHASERFVVLGYTIAASGLVLTYRRYLRTLPWSLALVALAFFGVSLAIDDVYKGGPTFERYLFVEEATKLLDITAWTLFFVWASRPLLLGLQRPAPRPDAAQSDMAPDRADG